MISSHGLLGLKPSRQQSGPEQLFNVADAVIDVPAASFGVGTGLEPGDASLIEHRPQCDPAGDRVQVGREGGFDEPADRCQPGG